jgi:hypothetical protein
LAYFIGLAYTEKVSKRAVLLLLAVLAKLHEKTLADGGSQGFLRNYY